MSTVWKEQYALSHARYVQMRTGEKTETDTLERAFQLKEMAMQLGSIKWLNPKLYL